jgi:hypothetical protein
MIETCEKCKGTGKDNHSVRQLGFCDVCDGSGLVEHNYTQEELLNKFKTCFRVTLGHYRKDGYILISRQHEYDFFNKYFIAFVTKLIPAAIVVKYGENKGLLIKSICDLNFLYDTLGFAGNNVCFEVKE